MEGREDLDVDTSRQLDLQFLSVLGRGSSARVLLARQPSSQRLVAVKLFKEDERDPFGTRRVMQEASIMQLLSHENIIELLEVGCVGQQHCLVLELAHRGSLHQYVMSRGGLPEPEAMVIFDQILAAMGHCHEQRVAHRDLKLKNLLLDSDMNVKLMDFGFSCQLPEGELVSGFCGTPKYSAPEVFQQEPYDPFAADIWSLGVILFAMLAGAMPFTGKDREEMRDCIQRGSYELPCAASPALEELLSSMLNLDPRDRPTVEVAWEHLWFDPLREGAKGEEVTMVQLLGVPKDPEAQEYLAGLGLLPDAGASVPSGPGGSSRMSLQLDSRSLEQGHREPEPELESESEVESDSELELEPIPELELDPELESELEPEPEPAVATPVLPFSLPGQLRERSPGASPAPEPIPVVVPSTPSPRSRLHRVVPEVPAAEPQEPGTSASASVPSKGWQGLGRRLGRSILRFLMCACCLPAPARSPGPRSRKVAPC